MASDGQFDGDESGPVALYALAQERWGQMVREETRLQASLHLREVLPAHYTWALATPRIRLVNMLLLDAELPPLTALDRGTATEVCRQIIGFTRHQMAVEAINDGRLPAEWDERDGDWKVQPEEYLRWRKTDPVWRYKGSVWPSFGFLRAGIDVTDGHNADGRHPAKRSRGSRERPDVAERHARHWEEVLGAALACLATWPDLCRTETTDRFNLAALIRLIEEKSGLFWPDELTPPLDRDTIEKRIRLWLRKTRQKGAR